MAMAQSGRRRYGKYHCDCGRKWNSAYTFCYGNTCDPQHAQDCQRCGNEVWAYTVQCLNKPDSTRDDDLSKPHKQALCGRCKHKPFPCSKGNNTWFDHSNLDVDEDEDDDLYFTGSHGRRQSYTAEITSAPDTNYNTNNVSSERWTHNNSSAILDLCSSSSDDDDIQNHNDQSHANTQMTQPQSAIHLAPIPLHHRDVQTQKSKHPLHHRDVQTYNSRKRSRVEMQYETTNVIQYETPVHKRRKLNKTVQSIATKYGWHPIAATNMISFKKENERLNVWVKKGKNYGYYSMRIQPMEISEKNITLDRLEEILAGMNEDHKENTNITKT
eukprot:549489_1